MYRKQDVLEILKDFGKSQITPKQVARVLGMMASTLSGLPEGVPFLGVSGEVTSHGAGKAPTTWDVKNFVAAVQTLVPNLIWRDVILELDYPGFFLPSPEALGLIMSVYRVASRDPFPMESLYLGWECPKGQLSWCKQALAGCPDFSFAQFPYRSMHVEDLKLNITSEEAKSW